MERKDMDMVVLVPQTVFSRSKDTQSKACLNKLSHHPSTTYGLGRKGEHVVENKN